MIELLKIAAYIFGMAALASSLGWLAEWAVRFWWEEDD